jgi:hypothetical protein
MGNPTNQECGEMIMVNLFGSGKGETYENGSQGKQTLVAGGCPGDRVANSRGVVVSFGEGSGG